MNQITNILIDILATALATAILCWIKSGISWISARCKTERVQLALQEFQTVLEDGVGYVEQTFVRIAKEGGTWDKAAQKEALGLCTDYIIANITESSMKLLSDGKEDIVNWVNAKIESFILNEKKR